MTGVQWRRCQNIFSTEPKNVTKVYFQVEKLVFSSRLITLQVDVNQCGKKVQTDNKIVKETRVVLVDVVLETGTLYFLNDPQIDTV